MVGPWIHYLEVAVIGDMGDLEYLSRIANGELTSGVLKHFLNQSPTVNTTVLGTVPVGKDWYLMGWSCSLDNVLSTVILEFPTGNNVDSLRADTPNTSNYNGIAKGDKATTGQTISRTLGGVASANVVNLFILEVDTGVSPQLT